MSENSRFPRTGRRKNAGSSPLVNHRLGLVFGQIESRLRIGHGQGESAFQQRLPMDNGKRQVRPWPSVTPPGTFKLNIGNWALLRSQPKSQALVPPYRFTACGIVIIGPNQKLEALLTEFEGWIQCVGLHLQGFGCLEALFVNGQANNDSLSGQPMPVETLNKVVGMKKRPFLH